MSVVPLSLRLEVWQSSRAGELPVWGAALVGTDGGLHLFCLPPVGLHIVPAPYDMLARLSPCHSPAEVKRSAAKHTLGWA
jgi:hypothetical protein